MEKETISYNKFKGQEIRVPCKECNKATFHNILCSVDVVWSLEHEGIWQDNSYQIVRCLGCHDLSFRRTSQFSEDVDFDEEGRAYIETHSDVYPSRMEGVRQMKEAWRLPTDIARIYRETHSALSNQQLILAGIGIRTIIEAICNEKKATGVNLEKKIDDLTMKRVMTNEAAELLHGTRILGNQSAHKITSFPEHDLGIAMEIIEHLLFGVYIIPTRKGSLPQRVAKGIDHMKLVEVAADKKE